jgi:hypothetical protein
MSAKRGARSEPFLTVAAYLASFNNNRLQPHHQYPLNVLNYPG